jgi:hypothetical protein
VGTVKARLVDMCGQCYLKTYTFWETEAPLDNKVHYFHDTQT